MAEMKNVYFDLIDINLYLVTNFVTLLLIAYVSKKGNFPFLNWVIYDLSKGFT